MPRVDGRCAVHAGHDAIHPKGLHLAVWANGSPENGAQRDLSIVDALHRIVQLQFILTVQLLRHLAGHSVCEDAQSIVNARREACAVCVIKDRFHSVHHLGMISTLVMPPVQRTTLSPAGSVGNSGAEIVLFRLKAP